MAVTLAGQFLQAVCTRDVAALNELTARLDETGWEDAEMVFAAGFELAVQQRFSVDHDVRAISRWVVDTVSSMNAQRVAPVLETEATIRRALGQDVAVSDIRPATVNTIRHMVVSVLAQQFGWTDGDIDAFVSRAEKLAISRGASLTPSGPSS
jgi:hypothetical protein